MNYSNKIKVLFAAFALSFALQGCDCIKGQLGMPTSKDIARMKEEIKIKEEQQKAIMERERFVQDSLASAAKAVEPVKEEIKGFHVIVGCFKEYANAEVLEQSMKSKGYEKALQIPLKNGYMMVSLGEIPTLSGAVAVMDEVTANESSLEGVWVYGATLGLHE